MIYQTQTAEEFYNQLYKLNKPKAEKIQDNQILVVDSMKVDEELISHPSIDLRFSLDFEAINKAIISNSYKTIILTSLQIEFVETCQYHIQSQPKKNRKQDRSFIDKSEGVINYVIEYIKVNNTDEKDILIYCQDLDEMDLYRRNLSQYSLFQIQLLLPNFVNELWQQSENHNKKNIYLALEPALIKSDQITLIFQTKNRIQTNIKNQDKLLFINKTVELSLYELYLRELPQAEKYPSKTIYLFAQEEYQQLKQFPDIDNQEKIDALQIVKNHLRNTVSQQLQQFFAIIISILQTPGLLLKQELNTNQNQTNNLTIRTSPYWQKTNDALSWVSIITYCGTRIEKLIELENDSFEYQQFEDWCNKQSINIIKVYYVLGYLQYWSEENNYTEISVIKTMGDIPLLRKQSSLQERTYERELIQLIAQYFQVAQLVRGSKSYQIEDISYNIHPRSTQQYLGHYQQHILILSLQDNQILSQTQLLHNLQRKESIQFKEQLYPNQGISMMKQIMQNNGIEILTFEKENNCQIEMNLDLNLISLQSEEDNFEETEKKFQSFLSLKKQNVLNCEVEIPFHNDTKFTMGSGGVILDWSKQYMNKNIIVRNLPLDIVEQDVRDLFEEFELKTLKLDYLKESCVAKITLNTQADIDDLIGMYDQCEYEGRVIEIQREISKIGFQRGVKRIDQFQYEIFYYGQLSKGKANVQFHKVQQAIDIAELLNNQTIDGKKVQVKQNNDSIQISNLNQVTTTYDLLQFCGGHKEVIDISHEVSQISESRNDPTLRLNELIKINADQQNRNIHLLKFKRKMQGLRKATYKANDIAQLQKIVDKMQGVKFTHQNYELKLYCVGVFCGQYQVNTLIRQLIEEKLQEFQQVKHLYKIKFIELDIVSSDGGLSKQYQAILKSRQHQLFQKIENTINQIITGTDIQIKDSQFLQGQQGQNIQRYLEDKYGVLIKYNRLNESVRVVGTDQIIVEIQQEIQAIIDKSSLKQQIQLSPKQIKQIIGHEGSGLQKLEHKFNVQLKYDSRLRELSVSGQHQNIEALKVAVNQILSNQQDTNSQELGQKTCTICLDNMENPFLLQVCSHSFCFECLSMTMQNALQNFDQLPIKCPQCKSLIIMDDIYNILNQEQQEKLKNLSINKYIQDNIKKIAFCYNNACPAINYISNDRYDCGLCMKSFCAQCKQNYHPGMTCEEFKIGDCALLLALMAKEDIRRCPNCKVLCQRISGCYRVTCPTCQWSICWKNKSDGKPCMLIFKQSSECYDHLTKVHGGYW